MKGGRAKESKVHRLSQESRYYTPGKKRREREKPVKLTAEQYLRKAKREEAVSGLIRSLYKTKVMAFAEWEREAALLLKKKIW